MGLSPQSTKKAMAALKEIAPKFPVVFATSRQQESLNLMQDVIVVKDEYQGNSEAVYIKTVHNKEYQEPFDKVKKVIGNTSFCFRPQDNWKEDDWKELVEGIWHIGWA